GRGRVRRPPRALVASISPPMALASSRAMYSPRPVPPQVEAVPGGVGELHGRQHLAQGGGPVGAARHPAGQAAVGRDAGVEPPDPDAQPRRTLALRWWGPNREGSRPRG